MVRLYRFLPCRCAVVIFTQSLAHGFLFGQAPSSCKRIPVRTVESSYSTNQKLPDKLILLSASNERELSDWKYASQNVMKQVGEISQSIGTAVSPFFQDDANVSAPDIVAVCDALDDNTSATGPVAEWIRSQALLFQRYQLLTKLMRQDYDTYIATASFLSPSRIDRLDLPNVQDVPIGPGAVEPTNSQEDSLVPDCDLPDLQYNDNPLDVLLLAIFRKLVAKNTNGLTSETPGIRGLLDQGRSYMLQNDPGTQQLMVRETLGDLMTPVLPPFYRIFMGGIVPKLGTEWDGKQLGPLFYAPWLTSIVTPVFFGFLVGPSYPNRRKDGKLGGLVVEKCKYLQESGCKGLCLHQCKLPAQEFFADELGLPLAVTPNFVTQECQWSFGETPVPVEEDPSFPRGCLVGCESRQAVAASGRTGVVCN